MWDDRFVFVVAALLAILYWILKDRLDRKFLLVGCIALTVLILGNRIWLYWPNRPNVGNEIVTRMPMPNVRNEIVTRMPNAGNAIAILLGVVFGIFTARFVLSLLPSDSGLPLDSEFKKRDPLVGASVLALLCVIYSLPLYSDAITNILSATGLSSVKTPFLELTLRERGTKGYVSASGGQPSLSGLARSSSPIPGLKWLEDDTNYDKKDSTFSADESYIRFFEKDVLDSEQYKGAVKDIKNFLESAHKLSTCLNKYVDTIPDSALLLVDIKPALESLFLQHRDMKQPDKDKVPFKFWSKINEITKYVRDKFQLHMWCDFDQMRFENKQEELVVEKTQPYTTLVLADLVYAHGAQDEGIEVLADWLTKNRNEKVVPQWWALRVESRIALWMADVAGQNNVAYRSFINTYKDHLQEYFEHSTATKTMNSHHVSLDQLDARCKIWEAGDFDSKARGSSLRSSRDAVVSDEKQLTINSQNAVMAEQKAFFLSTFCRRRVTAYRAQFHW